MLTIEGVIDDIIFRNEENGYTVARLATDEGNLTIVGMAPFLSVEETVEVVGDMTYHEKFGEQFKFEKMEKVIPTSLKGIEKYLSSGLIPNIGPKTAKNIVKKFGKDSLDIIQYSPNKLLKVKGIGEKTLESIVEAFEEQREIRDIMIFLQKYDISVNYSIKIYKKYGSDTIKIIQNNPYRLTEDIYGIGFKRADEIAKNMGISGEHPNRIKAGLNYVLNMSLAEGHCYLPSKLLLNRASEILSIDSDHLENYLRELAMEDRIMIVEGKEDKQVYLSRINAAENYVARKVIDLAAVKIKKAKIDIQEKISEIEEKEKIKFASKQRRAIEESINNGLMVITGGPGTGKTTTINAIIKICEDLNLKVVLAAPTGRAAKRMSETTNRDASTIHRLLEYSFLEDEAMAFLKNEEEPIEADLIIIDEASMIDISLMQSLLKAINPGSRVVLVGDIDQLPSVGPGNVLRDIIDSEKVPVVVLDEIFRQSEESMIIVNAHRINKGEYPILNKKDKDFYFMKRYGGDNVLETILDLVSKRLPNYYEIDPVNHIQVLSPMKKGDVGVNKLNISLQERLNPPREDKDEYQYGTIIYRVGDKVMQMKNNYNLKWKIYNNQGKVEDGEGIFNGDMGVITEIDKDSKTLIIVFDDEKEVEYDFKSLDEISLSYATTVHKSQGSEFPVIVMPISWGPPMLLMRNLLYTGITRAKQLVVLVGEEKFLQMMIKNNRIDRRFSALNNKIKLLADFEALREQ